MTCLNFQEPADIFQAAAGAKSKEMYKTGDLELATVSCGQGVGLINDIISVQELFNRIIDEAKKITFKLAKS